MNQSVDKFSSHSFTIRIMDAGERRTHSDFRGLLRILYLLKGTLTLRSGRDTWTRYRNDVIAVNSGFSNMKMFNQAFRKQFGVTPTEYRKKIISSEPMNAGTDDQETMKKVAEILPSDRKVTAFSYKIPVESGETGSRQKLQKNWDEIISVGRIGDLQNAAVRVDLLTFKKSIPVRYVRFWNILSKESRLGKFIPDDDKDYNYSFIDDSLDFLLENDLVPYFHLAFIFRDFDVMDQGQTTPGDGYHSLGEVVGAYTALFKHLASKYRKEVSNWVFDLWYPYPYMSNLPEYLREDDGNALPTQLYFAIRRILPGTRIGAAGLSGAAGFGMPTGNDEIGTRVRRLQQNGIRPDFISCIAFPYRHEARTQYWRDEGTRKWVLSSDFMYREIEGYRSILAGTAWEGIPIVITAYGITTTHRNILNDMRFNGCYMLHTILQVRKRVTGIGLYMLNDLYSSSADSKNQLFGGYGMIGLFRLCKPSFYAVHFLEHLLPYVISGTNNYILTTDGEDNYVLIIHNMRELSPRALCTDEKKLAEVPPDEMFDDNSPREYRFHLSGVTLGPNDFVMFQIERQMP